MVNVSREAVFESVAQSLAGLPGISRAKMFGYPSLRVQGKMFACLAPGGLVVKLPRQRVDALVAAGDGRPFDPGMGRTMKEWVLFPQPDLQAWLHLAEEARDFVAAAL